MRFKKHYKPSKYCRYLETGKLHEPVLQHLNENDPITYHETPSKKEYEEYFHDLFEVKERIETVGVYILPNGQIL